MPTPAAPRTTFHDRDMTMRKAKVPQPLRLPVHAVMSGRDLLERALFGKSAKPPKK